MTNISMFLSHIRGSPSWDYSGISASVLCITHCIATPMLAGIAPVLAATERQTHLGLTAALFLVGVLAFLPGRRWHGRSRPALTALSGFAMLVGAMLLPEGSSSEFLELGLTVAGGALLITAHLTNVYYCRRCRMCGELPCRTMGRNT